MTGENVMGKKAVFFDIDGTLWGFDNKIPESAKKAVHELRRNGHLAFLCSGRSRAFIREPGLLNMGFDGIISACGTMIEYHGETVFLKELDSELLVRTVKTLRHFGFRPILEGKEYLYMDLEDFSGDPYGKKLEEEMGEFLRPIDSCWGKWQVCKFSCATVNADQKGCIEALKEDYDFIVHNELVAELVPKGFHKGTGIRKVCELLGLDPADTIAFGDSVNDVGMFEAAGTAVAMGNGTQAAKDAADYVTDSLYEDGIWNACRHFGLI